MHVTDCAGSILNHELLTIKPVVSVSKITFVLILLPRLVCTDINNLVMEIVDLAPQVFDLGISQVDNNGLADNGFLRGLNGGFVLDVLVEVAEFTC